MAVTLEQVRAALDPEEPAYGKAARTLGPEALPHLARLITGDHPMLAAKATYLAGLIGTDKSVELLEKAARSGDPTVRIAAASAVGRLPAATASDLLLRLVDDADVGVQKIALNAIPAGASPALMARVESLGATTGASPIRALSREIMGRLGGSNAAGTKAQAESRSSSKKSSSKKSSSKAGATKKSSSKKESTKKGGTKGSSASKGSSGSE